MRADLDGDDVGLLVGNRRLSGMKMFEMGVVVLFLRGFRGWNSRERFRSELMMLKML